jgi:hydrogenase expression/formation protein HypD
MTIKHIEEYRDAELARQLAERIKKTSRRPVRLMEVCGTHTVSIFRSGIRSLLPDTVTLLSGPGCPVCVTDQAEIDAFIEVCRQPGVIVATFGDLMRVPGTTSSLQRERAEGRDIRVVYSTMDALAVARKHPDRQVVFLGVGFETTAPTIAAAVFAAAAERLNNFLVLSAHKTVPPALEALMSAEDVRIDGFILPGHVSVVIGLKAYRPFFERHRIPCAVAGFEPVDILQAIAEMIDQIESGDPRLVNAYPRAVTETGNHKAQQILAQVFEPADACWRGIGLIPESGLRIREAYAAHDAGRRFALKTAAAPPPRGCACGEILTGQKTPPECALYKKVCTPMDPVGPCMVSSEGTCAAYYRYHYEGAHE